MNEALLREAVAHVRDPKKRGHKKFDFTIWNVDEDGDFVPFKCGYAGCFIGEMPVCFPEEWEYDEVGEPVLKGEVSSLNSACEFFGITMNEAIRLFMPCMDHPWGKLLSNGATAKQVCDNVIKFIEWKKNKESLKWKKEY